jgi:hypothetical protein
MINIMQLVPFVQGTANGRKRCVLVVHNIVMVMALSGGVQPKRHFTSCFNAQSCIPASCRTAGMQSVHLSKRHHLMQSASLQCMTPTFALVCAFISFPPHCT